MKVRNFAFVALLGVSALGYSLGAGAMDASGNTGHMEASGNGVSAQSSVGRADNTNDASSQPITSNVSGGNQTGAGGTTNDKGSGTADDYSSASTPRSQTLNTSDSSSSDTIPDNGAKDNANRSTGQAQVTPTTSTTVVSFNDLQNSQIRSIQSSLRTNGFRVANDGVWGPRSAAALRDFQAKNNLTVNGQLDSPTISALNVNDIAVHTVTTPNDARTMNDESSSAGGAEVNGNSSTTGQDNGSGTGY